MRDVVLAFVHSFANLFIMVRSSTRVSVCVFACSCVDSVVRLIVCAVVFYCGRSFVLPSILLLARSSVQSLARVCMCSSSCSFTHKFCCSLVRAVVYSCVCYFVRSVVRSLVCSVARSFLRSLVIGGRSFASSLVCSNGGLCARVLLRVIVPCEYSSRVRWIGRGFASAVAWSLLCSAVR